MEGSPTKGFQGDYSHSAPVPMYTVPLERAEYTPPESHKP